MKIWIHKISIMSLLSLALALLITSPAKAQSVPLLIFYDSNVDFDQQFQQTLAELLRKEGEGFKFVLMALGEEKTKQAMERYKVSEEEFPIVLVLTKDEKQVEKRLPRKRNGDGNNAACEAFYQITGKLIERINPKDGAVMVYIPSGEFMMGTDQDEIDQIWQKFGWHEEWKQYAKNESPKHRVYVDGFWMYKYEVTVAQYRKFCNETPPWRRQMPTKPPWGWQDNHPIIFVGWNDAVAYCNWAGVQLPTEAQWEYAARGGNTGLNGKPRYIFVWGDELPKGKGGYGNFADESFNPQMKALKKKFPDLTICEGYDDGYVHTAPVGSFNPNKFGLYDMAGNVLEWCADWYDKNYYQNSPTRNPPGPSSGTLHVLRSGNWGGEYPGTLRAATRGSGGPDTGSGNIGFRGIALRFPR